MGISPLADLCVDELTLDDIMAKLGGDVPGLLQDDVDAMVLADLHAKSLIKPGGSSCSKSGALPPGSSLAGGSSCSKSGALLTGSPLDSLLEPELDQPPSPFAPISPRELDFDEAPPAPSPVDAEVTNVFLDSFWHSYRAEVLEAHANGWPKNDCFQNLVLPMVEAGLVSNWNAEPIGKISMWPAAIGAQKPKNIRFQCMKPGCCKAMVVQGLQKSATVNDVIQAFYSSSSMSKEEHRLLMLSLKRSCVNAVCK